MDENYVSSFNFLNTFFKHDTLIFKNIIDQYDALRLIKNLSSKGNFYNISADSKFKKTDAFLYRMFSQSLNIYLNRFNIRIGSNAGITQDIGYYFEKKDTKDRARYIIESDSSINNVSTISAKLFLNSDFIGGDIEYTYYNYQPIIESPMLLIYPSIFTHAYIDEPVKAGTRFTITTCFK